MEYLTPQQVAELCRVHPSTVRWWLREKRLPGRHIGRKWWIAQDDVTRFLEGEGGGIDEDRRSQAAAVSSGWPTSGASASTSGAGFSSASSGRSLTPRIIG